MTEVSIFHESRLPLAKIQPELKTACADSLPKHEEKLQSCYLCRVSRFRYRALSKLTVEKFSFQVAYKTFRARHFAIEFLPLNEQV